MTRTLLARRRAGPRPPKGHAALENAPGCGSSTIPSSLRTFITINL